jgi:hypothetical protein
MRGLLTHLTHHPARIRLAAGLAGSATVFFAAAALTSSGIPPVTLTAAAAQQQHLHLHPPPSPVRTAAANSTYHVSEWRYLPRTPPPPDVSVMRHAVRKPAPPPPPPSPAPAASSPPASQAPPPPPPSSPPDPPAQAVYSFAGLEGLWDGAGGPAGEASAAATIAECESGGRADAVNPSSGAAGLWQILGAPEGWSGSDNWLDPRVNARAAVAKFRAAGGWAPWTCQP